MFNCFYFYFFFYKNFLYKNQARDIDEREKWVRRLEDTILRHANRSRGIFEPYFGGSSHGLVANTTKKPDHIFAFDRRVSEADVYLQLMIDQTAVSFFLS